LPFAAAEAVEADTEGEVAEEAAVVFKEEEFFAYYYWLILSLLDKESR